MRIEDCRLSLSGRGMWMVLPSSNISSLGFLRDDATAEEAPRGRRTTRSFFSALGAFGSRFLRGLGTLTLLFAAEVVVACGVALSWRVPADVADAPAPAGSECKGDGKCECGAFKRPATPRFPDVLS